MTQSSQPWPGRVVGDAGPYSADDWQQMYQNLFGFLSGVVLLSSGTPGLAVAATSPAAAVVTVAAGAAFIRGLYYQNDASITLAIAPNTSGNPRIDRVVLRVDYIAQTIRLVTLQGAPAVSPAAPALTQDAGVRWEESLALVAVANGFITITGANITDTRRSVGIDGTVIGGTTPAAGTFTTVLASTASGGQVALNGPAATNRILSFQTSFALRWLVYVDSSAEGGADAGSNLYIQSRSDAGVPANRISINRASGVVTIATGLTLSGALDHDGSTVGFYGNTPVARQIYGAPTGTATRTAFATGSVTLPQLAERVKALIDDLRSVGLMA